MAEQTEQVYEWDVARIGDESPEYVYEVTRENIADYCRAVRYENPIYVNDGAAREAGLPGAVAPPTMMYTYAPQRRSAVIEAQGSSRRSNRRPTPAAPPSYQPRSTSKGPTCSRGTPSAASPASPKNSSDGGNKFITFHVSATNQRGEPVVEYDYVCLWEYSGGAKAEG